MAKGNLEPRPKNINPSEKIWLVKSAGIILGPFNWLELADALAIRQVSLIDEIRDPWVRWSFIREHVELKDLVKKIRDENASRHEDTATAESTDKEITITEELTPLPKATTPQPIRQFGHASDKNIKQHLGGKRKKWKALLWTSAVVVASLTAAIYFTNRSEGPKSLSADDYLRLARHHRNLGVYTKALSFYRKAENIKPLDLATRIQMLPLLLVVDNQVLETRRWLDEILKQGPVDPKLKPELENLRGLSFLKEGNYPAAEEEFRKSLGASSSYYPAISNLVTAHFLEKKYAEVVLSTEDLDKNGQNSKALGLMHAMGLLFSTPALTEEKFKKKAEPSIHSIESFLSNSSDFKAESLLITAALYLNAKDLQKTEQTLAHLLDEVPDRMKDVILELNIDYQALGWENLKQVCHWMIKDKLDKAEFAALDSYCTFGQGEVVQALDKISQLRTRFPNEKRWMNLQAYYLKSMGRNSEAAALVKNFATENFKLMSLVKGSLCLEEKDLRCAETAFQSVLDKDPREVIAFWGIAQVNLERNQKELSKQMVKKGLIVSPNYRPLVEMKEDLGEL